MNASSVTFTKGPIKDNDGSDFISDLKAIFQGDKQLKSAGFKTELNNGDYCNSNLYESSVKESRTNRGGLGNYSVKISGTALSTIKHRGQDIMSVVHPASTWQTGLISLSVKGEG